jgi:Spy/CpxP family protein refolding chaperone
MPRSLVLAVAGSVLLYGTPEAQQHDPTRHVHGRPYAGLESRTIKALSEAQIADLEAGRGMGLALAAELNGYPGPLHALDLADALNLTPAQRSRIKGLYEAMRTEAVAAGKELIDAEAALEKVFTGNKADEKALDAAMHAVGHAYTVLRRTHLGYHLATRAVLTPEQVARYKELRGYGKR